MPDRFPALDALIRDAEAVAAERPDVLRTLVVLLKAAIASDTDPYLLTGALIEGIAATVAHRIPAETQGDVSVEIVRLLRDRLRAQGTI
jgi:hypothetical protein